MNMQGGEQMKLDVKKIKLILASQELNQSDLAKKCRISRQQLNSILLRESCTLKTVGKIAKSLGVPVQEIVKEE